MAGKSFKTPQSANLCGSLKTGPLHHLVTWYENLNRQDSWIAAGVSSRWIDASRDILKNAGWTDKLIKKSGKNLIYLKGRNGPHPIEYWEEIHNRLSDAVQGLAPHTDEYADAVDGALGKAAADLADYAK